MDNKFELVKSYLAGFVSKFPVLSFKLEYNEIEHAILVSYIPNTGLSDTDEAWDYLFKLKCELTDLIGENNILFGEMNLLFTLSPKAIEIPETVRSIEKLLDSSFVWIKTKEIKKEVEPYFISNYNYCLAA